MKQDIKKIIEIPEEIEININGNKITIKGKEGELTKSFKLGKVKIEKKENQIEIFCKNGTKREKKIIHTLNAHIKNMIKGVKEKFEYQLKICASHFPVTIDLKESEAIIKNFLGEKIPRKAKILQGVEVKINKDIIEIKSCDKELAGQVAANFEKATWVKMKDRRVFQDGIFMINKAGREI